MNWANAELKIDVMKDEIKSLKQQVKLLELDLVKTKQNLGKYLRPTTFLICDQGKMTMQNSSIQINIKKA